MSDASSAVVTLIAALLCDLPEECASQADRSKNAITEGHPSFETILRTFHKRVYNLAYRLLGDFEEAADLTQETFVKAYKAYPRFRGTPEAIHPWLCRIATNSCKNKFKEINRRSRHEARSLDEPVEIEDSIVGFEVGDESADPAGIMEQRDLETRIQEAMQELPPEFRIVVVMRDMQGLSYKEIAEAIGTTVETVKVRLFRGRRMLRRRLGPYLEK